MTIRELFAESLIKLETAQVPNARNDLYLLLEATCDISHSDFLLHPEMEVDSEKKVLFEKLLSERCKRVPLQYLLRETCFMGFSFLVNEHVLIPRPDTEVLVEAAQKSIRDGERILDLCTGSGCILISLLKLSKAAFGVGVDLSGKALEVAKENANKLLGESEERYRFLEGDLFEPIADERFDVLVSNPPYIESAVIESLEPEVKEYEPHMALDGSTDGLLFYRRIARKAPEVLAEGGRIFLEIGYNQAEAVTELLAAAGFVQIEVIKDYAGLDRVVCATRGEGPGLE